MRLCIVDYGMGNIKSLQGIFDYLAVDKIDISSDWRVIRKADKLILPGVGAFSEAMSSIDSASLIPVLKELVLVEKKPILGICLGMQLLCKASQENGETQGLNLIDASCTRFCLKEGLKIPHVGFNQVDKNPNSILFSGLDQKSDFYFTHSYKVLSNFDVNQSICNYGEDFIAAFEKDNVFGVQFHPELSQTNGVTLLKNFIKL